MRLSLTFRYLPINTYESFGIHPQMVFWSLTHLIEGSKNTFVMVPVNISNQRPFCMIEPKTSYRFIDLYDFFSMIYFRTEILENCPKRWQTFSFVRFSFYLFMCEFKMAWSIPCEPLKERWTKSFLISFSLEIEVKDNIECWNLNGAVATFGEFGRCSKSCPMEQSIPIPVTEQHLTHSAPKCINGRLLYPEESDHNHQNHHYHNKWVFHHHRGLYHKHTWN